MINYNEFLHYFSIIGIVGINSLAVAWAQGLVGQAGISAINMQPQAHNNIRNVMLFGTALIEASAIFALLLAFFMFANTASLTQHFYTSLSELGILFALGAAGAAAAVAAGKPAQAACAALARQPFSYTHIIRLMFLSQSIIQTAVIFALVLCFAILDQGKSVTSLEGALQLISVGIAIGVGSIGPTTGLGRFTYSACQSIGENPRAFDEIFAFTLLSNAVIEAPTIFAFVVAIILLTVESTSSFVAAIALLSAALTIGIGTLGPGIGSGTVAAAACSKIAQTPEKYSILSRTSLLCQAIIDTCAIYALLLALLLVISQY